MLKIELKGDQVLLERIDARPEGMRRALTREVTAIILELERHIKADKLSGQVLHVRSGDLRRSVHSVLPVTQTPTGVVGQVAQSGDVKYGRIHEFGGKTPAHIIEAKKGEALAFMWRGKQVFFKKVNHPGSTMPERSYMRSGLADMRSEITLRLRAVVKDQLDLRK